MSADPTPAPAVDVAAIRTALDRWEVGLDSQWVAMAAIRSIVGGDSSELRNRMSFASRLSS